MGRNTTHTHTHTHMQHTHTTHTHSHTHTTHTHTHTQQFSGQKQSLETRCTPDLKGHINGGYKN